MLIKHCKLSIIHRMQFAALARPAPCKEAPEALHSPCHHRGKSSFLWPELDILVAFWYSSDGLSDQLPLISIYR